MNVLVFHGGPGFNSFAEQSILGPVFAKRNRPVAFWSEPSLLRPDGDSFVPGAAFEGWLESAQRFLVEQTTHGPALVVAHSFSAVLALELSRRRPDLIESLVLVGPCVDATATFRNVLYVAQGDLASSRPEIAASIADCLTRARVMMDDAMHQGLVHVLEDDRLFSHYWANADQMRASLEARNRPDGQFDAESFFAVFKDFTARGAQLLSTSPVATPVLALFGDLDAITPIEDQQAAILRMAPGSRLEVVARTSHYLHLDRPDYFVERLEAWTASRRLSSGTSR